MRVKETSKIVSSLGVTTALVCAATMLFTVYVPATKGFFNMGETMVYISAIIFGPFVGAFAGGVGSMLADLLLGYYYYAPATLLIKASEGFIVGFLCNCNPKLSVRGWKIITSLLGLFVGILLSFIGSAYYSGDIELTLGRITLAPYIPQTFWIMLGVLVAALIILASFVMEPQTGWIIFSIIAGGFIMVLGYFIYEAFLIGTLFGIEAIAIAEVPVNIGQMVVGLIVAVPIARVIKAVFRRK
ncbi:MAG: ECF transporter S component [Candidatus Bathyarchaeia archaeon]|nr:ECF transporter S component [Candidatus Bathyarchaeota archaeon]